MLSKYYIIKPLKKDLCQEYNISLPTFNKYLEAYGNSIKDNI